MSMCVCTGASMMCSMGSAPSSLVVPPTNRVFESTPAMGATIMDMLPYVNILPFGVCTSPALIAAMVAAGAASTSSSGTPLFVPCIPACIPWLPINPTVLLGTFPILAIESVTQCGWGGQIKLLQPGQFTVQTTLTTPVPEDPAELEIDMEVSIDTILKSTMAAADLLIAEGRGEEALEMMFHSALLLQTDEDIEANEDRDGLLDVDDKEEMSPERNELFEKMTGLQQQIKAEKEAAGIEEEEDEDALYDMDFIIESWAEELEEDELDDDEIEEE